MDAGRRVRRDRDKVKIVNEKQKLHIMVPGYHIPSLMEHPETLDLDELEE